MVVMIRVMSVDDHPVMREGVAAIIHSQRDLSLIAEAWNGREAIEVFRRERPDVVLMDLRLPDMTGIEALLAIRSEFPEAQVIMLTTFEGDAGSVGHSRPERAGTSSRACRRRS